MHQPPGCALNQRNSSVTTDAEPPPGYPLSSRAAAGRQHLLGTEGEAE